MTLLTNTEIESGMIIRRAIKKAKTDSEVEAIKLKKSSKLNKVISKITRKNAQGKLVIRIDPNLNLTQMITKMLQLKNLVRAVSYSVTTKTQDTGINEVCLALGDFEKINLLEGESIVCIDTLMFKVHTDDQKAGTLKIKRVNLDTCIVTGTANVVSNIELPFTFKIMQSLVIPNLTHCSAPVALFKFMEGGHTKPCSSATYEALLNMVYRDFSRTVKENPFSKEYKELLEDVVYRLDVVNEYVKLVEYMSFKDLSELEYFQKFVNSADAFLTYAFSYLVPKAPYTVSVIKNTKYNYVELQSRKLNSPVFSESKLF